MLEQLGVPGSLFARPGTCPLGACTHIIFTSSTTPDPKTVEAAQAKAIVIRRLDADTRRAPVEGALVIYEPVLITDLAAALNASGTDKQDAGSHAFADAFFPTRGASVLLVDDNDINLMVAEELLRRYGIEPDTATRGEEAVAFAARRDYDIIFMDHMMPGMDGIEATRVIRTLNGHYAHAPVIALTANALVGMQEFFMENGLSDYISKPIEINDMSRVLRTWLPPEKITDDTR